MVIVNLKDVNQSPDLKPLVQLKPTPTELKPTPTEPKPTPVKVNH